MRSSGARLANIFPARSAGVWARRLRSALGMVMVFAIAGSLSLGALAAQKQQKQPKNKKNDKQDESVDFHSQLPDPQAIDLMISQMLATWQVGDVDAMHKFYADDVTVVSGSWEPPLLGWDNYARAYKAQRARIQAGRLDRVNTFTRMMGDSACVTYQWQFSGDVDGKHTMAVGQTTLVMQKRAGNWIILLNHTSAIPPAAPAAPVAAPASAVKPGGSGD
jgi:uncharacterized protein (TIGR02246 family)